MKSFVRRNKCLALEWHTPAYHYFEPRQNSDFGILSKIKLVMTRNKDDEKDLFDMLGTKDDRKEFDRQFKNPKSNFKISIVVDMWLTGFDVPELDTIYIDKPIQQHSLEPSS